MQAYVHQPLCSTDLVNLVKAVTHFWLQPLSFLHKFSRTISPLPIDAEGGVRFSLPTMLKPRYTPEGSTDPLAPVEGESEQVEQGKIKGVHQFELTVFDAEEVSSVVSLGPPTLLQYLVRETQIKVTLSESIALHNDLVVLIAHKEPHKPRALVEQGLPLKESKTVGFLNRLAIMVNFFPDIPSLDTQNEFIFLVFINLQIAHNFSCFMQNAAIR